MLPWQKPVVSLSEALMLIVAEANENGDALALQGGDYMTWWGLSYRPDRTALDAFGRAMQQMRQRVRTGKIRGMGKDRSEISEPEWSLVHLDVLSVIRSERHCTWPKDEDFPLFPVGLKPKKIFAVLESRRRATLGVIRDMLTSSKRAWIGVASRSGLQNSGTISSVHRQRPPIALHRGAM